MRFEFDPATMEPRHPSALPVTVLIGRFQPFHRGHARLISDCQSNNQRPVLACVHSGGKRNPFSRETIEQLVAWTKIPILFFEVGYIPLIVSELRRMDAEVHRVVCGPDRLDTYTKQLARENAKIADDRKVIATISSPEKRFFDVSGTQVRKLLEDGSYDEFKNCMPQICHYDYHKMRSELLASK